MGDGPLQVGSSYVSGETQWIQVKTRNLSYQKITCNRLHGTDFVKELFRDVVFLRKFTIFPIFPEKIKHNIAAKSRPTCVLVFTPATHACTFDMLPLLNGRWQHCVTKVQRSLYFNCTTKLEQQYVYFAGTVFNSRSLYFKWPTKRLQSHDMAHVLNILCWIQNQTVIIKWMQSDKRPAQTQPRPTILITEQPGLNLRPQVNGDFHETPFT